MTEMTVDWSSDLRMRAMVRFESHYMTFKAWWSSGEGVRSEDGTSLPLQEPYPVPLVQGTVKWDGCANLDFSPEEVLLHTCSREEWGCISQTVDRLYNLAQERFAF